MNRDELRMKLHDLLGDFTYKCLVEQGGWAYGEVDIEDFSLAREDDEFVDSILDIFLGAEK